MTNASLIATLRSPAIGPLASGRHWLGLLLLLLLVAGCSGTRVVYNQLDWVVVWQLKKYFDLDGDQQQELREIVGRQLAWHRETQLPRYAAFAANLERSVAQPPGPEYFERRLAEMLVFWADFMAHAAPDAAAFLSSLSDRQVEQLFENIEKNNEELAEEYAGDTAAIRREKRERAIVRTVSGLTGRLTGAQQALVADYSDRMHDLSLAWLDRRREWQQEFRAALAVRHDTIELERRLAPLLVDPDRNDPPEYRALVEENQQIVFEMLAALAAELTPRQRERFQRRLRNYSRDFTLLAEAAA